jgi:TRAP transporter TAXI family solute receptor
MWLRIRELAYLIGPAVLLIAAALWLASLLVQPAPPTKLAIATGGTSGGYYAFGKRYAEILAKSGIELEVLSTAGSVENASLLADPNAGVSVALMQGGIANSADLPQAMSLGRVTLEPLWVFYRANKYYDRLVQLRGKRLAVGREGSGTRKLAETLLAANGAMQGTTLLPLSGMDAIMALATGEADAIFFVLSPDSKIVADALRNPSFRLMNFAQADAISRLFPYLQKVILPKGVVDLVANIPPADVSLLASSAALVARNDLHPALAGLFVEAAQSVHSGSTLIYGPGTFPQALDPELPMSDDAARVYKSGQSFLKRVLPFWLATFIERTLIIAVPLAAFAFPVFKLAPLLYEWHIKRRIYHWYEELKQLEGRLVTDGARLDAAVLSREIQRIDDAAAVIPVPLRYSENLYNLRMAIGLVKQKIQNLPASA